MQIELPLNEETKFNADRNDLPDGWRRVSLGDFVSLQFGYAFQSSRFTEHPDHIKLLRGDNITPGQLRWNDVKRWPSLQLLDVTQYLLEDRDLVLAMDRPWVGKGLKIAVVRQTDLPCLLVQRVARLRAKNKSEQMFLAMLLSQASFSDYLQAVQTGAMAPHISGQQIARFICTVPPLTEQARIVTILEAVDTAVRAAESLIEAKTRYKRALAEQLLIGKRRFPEFAGQGWQEFAIGTFAAHENERNSGSSDYPVLSCTKHRGLVLASDYFGKRIHSDNLTDYKVVRHGNFAYATNHIEEGSIGLQVLCAAGVVSPMYTVFSINEDSVDRVFLFALLKTTRYQEIFASLTSASVNRRGSLRWPNFAKIRVTIPELPEQQKIAEVLGLLDEEIALLRRELEALKRQKQGLMQALLTGRKRVKEFRT